MSETNIKAAEYFAGRAKRARTPDDRARFLALVQKYQDRASGADSAATKARDSQQTAQSRLRNR
jgi:hypothetical protein